MEYAVITRNDSDQLSDIVTAKMSAGWRLFGAPIIAYDPNAGEMVYAQTVIKKQESPADGNPTQL